MILAVCITCTTSVTLAILEDELKTSNDRIHDLEDQLESSFNITIRCFNDKSKLSLDLTFATDDITKKNFILDQNTLTIESQENKIVESTKTLEKASTSLEECKLSSTKLETDLKDAQIKLQTMIETNNINKQFIDDLNKQIEILTSESIKKETDLELIEDQNALIFSETKNNQQIIDDQTKKIADIENNLVISQRNLGSLQAGYNSLFNQIYN